MKCCLKVLSVNVPARLIIKIEKKTARRKVGRERKPAEILISHDLLHITGGEKFI